MSFTLFQKLPAELRVMIWEATLPGPILFGDCFAIQDIQRMKYLPQFNKLLDSYETNKDPATLFVNFESRHLALKHLTKINNTELDCPILGTYVNYKKDVAAFDYDSIPPSDLRAYDIVEWNKVTRLIITYCPDEIAFTHNGTASLESVFEWLLRLSSLKEAVLDIGGECECEDEHETVALHTGPIVKLYGCSRERRSERLDLIALYMNMLKREFGEMAEELADAQSGTLTTW